MITVTTRRLEDLKHADYNPRKITDHELAQLRNSIEHWGMVQPLIVNKRNDLIIGGHQRATAAGELGLEEVPVVEVDLDDDEAKALNLALNKLGGTWDTDQLDALLRTLGDKLVDLAGFDPDKIKPAEPVTESEIVSFNSTGHSWSTEDHHRIKCPHPAGKCDRCNQAKEDLRK